MVDWGRDLNRDLKGYPWRKWAKGSDGLYYFCGYNGYWGRWDKDRNPSGGAIQDIKESDVPSPMDAGDQSRPKVQKLTITAGLLSNFGGLGEASGNPKDKVRRPRASKAR
jgi:hypothetical protein